MTQDPAHPRRHELIDRVAAFSAAIEAGDPETAATFIDDEFRLIFLHPEYQVVPRDRWLALLPNVTVNRVEILHEDLAFRGDTAIQHRLASMETSWSGIERNGEFCMTDHWFHDDERGWILWQRLSTPLDAGVMP